jgi:glutaredoxin-like protein NrdH
MSVVVYGKPKCPQCEKAKESLNKNKIDFTYIDLSLEENKKDLEMIKGLGFRSVPVIMEDDEPVTVGYLIS